MKTPNLQGFINDISSSVDSTPLYKGNVCYWLFSEHFYCGPTWKYIFI